jgi:ribokinase
MKTPVEICVLGSINLDIVATGAVLPKAGETVTGARLAYHPGGKGANQALAAQKLGAQVTVVGCVGTDSASVQALELLKVHGVHLDYVQHDESHPTGVALIAVDQSGENQIIVAPGANEAVTAACLELALTQNPDALICQLEIPIATIEAAAKQFKGFFAINLAPAAPIAPDTLARADLIIVNETEAAFYGDQLDDVPGLVVVTLGAKGAQMRTVTGELITATPPRVSPIDTTGAGDTFVGALVVALLEGQTHQSALNFACAAGAAATQMAGAQPSMPDRSGVQSLMDRRS